MKLKVALEIEAEQVALFDGKWYCGNNCLFNDSGEYCQLFNKNMTARLSECILSQIKEEDNDTTIPT